MHCKFSKKIENDPTDDIIKFKQKEIIEKNHGYDYFTRKIIFMRKCGITFCFEISLKRTYTAQQSKILYSNIIKFDKIM